MFHVVTPGRTFRLQADSEADMRDWIRLMRLAKGVSVRDAGGRTRAGSVMPLIAPAVATVRFGSRGESEGGGCRGVA